MINADLHVVHARAAGLDVHKMKITATVRICEPQGGKAQCQTCEFSALPSGLTQLAAWLVECNVTAAGMEGAGIYWEAPWRALDAAGIKVELYHAQHVKQLRGRKTDIQDSRWLARICQFGLGNPSLVVSEQFRQLRCLSRFRRQMIKDRTRVRNRVQRVLDRRGARVGGILSDVFGMNGRRILEGLIGGKTMEQIVAGLSGHLRGKLDKLTDALCARLSDTDLFTLKSLVHQHDLADERIAEYSERIEAGLGGFESKVRLLETIPGICRESACTIIIEIGGTIAHFANADHFSSWCGVSPGNDESAGKRRNSRSVRGNPHIRTVLIECAIAASRTKGCQFKSCHKAIHVRRGYKRAIVAAAHKLVKEIFSVLKNNKAYVDPKFNYEALMVERNASRWITKLREYGHLKMPENQKRTATLNI